MSLRFDREEIEDLVATPYGKGRMFALLALLYPGIDARNQFHVDHVFPRSRFTLKRLAQAGIASDEIPEFMDRVNRLPNLQLLEGPINQSKLSMLPLGWAQAQHPDTKQRGLYLAGHDLDGLPVDLSGFLDFFDRRQRLMADRLSALLGVEKETSSSAASTTASPDS